MKRTSIFVAVIAVVIFVADQLTKLAIIEWIGVGRSWTPFPDHPGLFNLVGGMNTGTACGYFPQFSVIFTFAPLLIVPIVIYFYRQQANPGWLLSLGTGLIIGGAFGNLLDRLRLGFVLDFVQILNWPVFNVADASISTAVVILLFWSLREDSRSGATAGQEGIKSGASGKLILSFLVVLGILAALAVFVCVWLPGILRG
jgi:signal peptidase II